MTEDSKTSLTTITDQDWVIQFQALSHWEDKYRQIIGMGKKLPPLEKKYQTQEYLVKGCQSQVWLVAQWHPPHVDFKADSDALIVKGLIAILLKVYSGKTPDQILAFSPKFIEELGLNTHLSQTRANGLVAMIKQIRYYAIAFSSFKN